MDFSLEELKEFLTKEKQAAYHAKQIFSWIYKKSIQDFNSMSDLSKKLRQILERDLIFEKLLVKKSQTSRDGTQKFLFELDDGNLIESVAIPQDNRNTFCISTQVGCKFKCKFCASGAFGFKRNLEVSEILNQVLFLKQFKQPTNIVFMGIGEPLDNYENVLKAIRIINSKEAFNIGARRITISTCGIIPGIKKLMKENLQVELSVSLHASDNKTRDLLLPINKTYPLEKLIDVCREYYKRTKRQVTFEYVLIKDLNCRKIDADNLAELLVGFDAKINLIPCNEVKEPGFLPPNKLDVLFFKQALMDTGLKVTLRKERGRDIEAACGQLKWQYLRK